MSIHYNGVDQYHAHTTSAFLGTIYTMACWVRFHAFAGGLVPVFVRTRTAAPFPNDRFEGITRGFDDLIGGGPSNGTKIHAVSYVSGVSYAVAVGTTSILLNVWYHVLATFRGPATVKRVIYVNGVQEAGEDATKAVAANSVSYAVLDRSSGLERFDHLEIAEPAFWNGELSLDEIAALGTARAIPDEIRPDKLFIWNRFIGVPPQAMMETPTSWTTGGIPTTSPHPPVSEPVPMIG